MKRDLTLNELASDLEASPLIIRRWVREGCPQEMVQGKKGRPAYRFSRIEVANWLESKGRTGKPGRPVSDTSIEKRQLQVSILRTQDQLVKIKLETTKLQLEASKIDLEKTIGGLLSKAEVEAWRLSAIQMVRNGLLGMSSAIVPSLVGLKVPEMQEIIDKEVYKLLTHFSKQ